ncbi:right-handed parallel beta-helix repeat-containing protein [Chitinophaga eiseniae]|uniref:Right-handed parallel beta-helix repeat-containing protein n=1 Tax=Chitinophaga eiseniae TaxID=634771 RepID=A0A847SPW2_9BACT|nr:right-handed parallel beta-helix repeat-containing protein [Chitinophaga eiseniae]NLR81455.1 right-handed parallel beta-helix repeat-containing protein [Chitinophaga eiseniae]
MNYKQIIGSALLIAILGGACKKANSDVDLTKEVAGAGTVAGEVYGIWEKGSTKRISGDIIIPEGKSLVIEEGVLVIMDTLAKPEVIVKGNLYSMGTKEFPVRFTIEENLRTDSRKFGKQWGGILAAQSCKELLLDNTVVEYGGATTTESSTSVKQGLYKAKSGENLPALWFSNVNGKLVVTNSTFRHFQDDCTYIEGGKIIFANNKFYSTGLVGGEGINIKSGCLADVGFNFFYATNTNALKLSNSGNRSPQAHVIAYNNTILNTGWRRPTVKGGSVWLEATVYAELYNNLFANARFGIKRDTKGPEDQRSAFSNNLYYGFDQATVTQFQPSKDVVGGKNDLISTTVGDHDPKFVNYPLNTAMNNPDLNESWDFHVQAGSPAIGAGTTAFTRNFPDGLVLNGKLYLSPAPSSTIGALGTKN